jgi:hypothetical protein
VFAQSLGTSFPIFGVDLPSPLLAQLTLHTSWIIEDETWRSILGNEGVKGSERHYAETVRDHVAGWRAGLGAHKGGPGGGGSGGGKKGGGFAWLFSVREGRGFLLQNGK